MHIAYLASEYPHIKLPPAGGIGSFIQNLSIELLNKGHKVSVILVNAEQDSSFITDEGVKIFQLKRSKGKLGSLFYRFLIAQKIGKFVKENNVEILESADWEGYHSFLNLQIPIITRLHGSVTYFNLLENKKTSRLMHFFELRALQKSDKIVSVSRFAGEVTQTVFKLKNFEFEVIYNGIDTEKFKTNTVIDDKKDILYFGTLVRKKGVLELPYVFNEVIKLIPKAKLYLIGKDSLDATESCSTWALMQKKFSDEALKNVIYKGSMSYNLMQNEISKATLCVFPSFAEAFPISWLEAMAMEKGIVASNIGWASEALTNNSNAFLCNPKDHDHYSQKICELLDDNKLRETFGQLARKAVCDNFSNKKLIYDNLDFYNRILLKNAK